MDAWRDVTAVSQLILAWGLWRDQGRWAELSGSFTEDGTIRVSWFAGSFSTFVERSKAMKAKSRSLSKHLIWPPVVRVRGERALGETTVAITGRAEISGVLVDTVAQARFLDRVQNIGGAWRIAERIAIYEKDRIDPVEDIDGFAAFMASTDFSKFPTPCRYLGSRLAAAGFDLVLPIYCDGTPETQLLYRGAESWLDGNDIPAQAYGPSASQA